MVDENDERSHGIMPRWVHVVREGGWRAIQGRCDMGLLVPEGVFVYVYRGPQAGILKGAWYIDPHAEPYPHRTDHQFGSWHDLDECHGAAHE